MTEINEFAKFGSVAYPALCKPLAHSMGSLLLNKKWYLGFFWKNSARPLILVS